LDKQKRKEDEQMKKVNYKKAASIPKADWFVPGNEGLIKLISNVSKARKRTLGTLTKFSAISLPTHPGQQPIYLLTR